MLALSKQDYHGKDFFQRSEFRGLLLADYQEAIGEKAFQCVDSLNTNTVSQFSELKSFKEALSKRKLLDKFYKQGGIKQYTAMKKSAMTQRASPDLTLISSYGEGTNIPKTIPIQVVKAN